MKDFSDDYENNKSKKLCNYQWYSISFADKIGQGSHGL